MPHSENESEGPPQKKHKTEHDLLVITPDIPGDMVIKLVNDDDVGMLRVHKSTMMLASRYIRTMLQNHRFKEGNQSLDENDPLVLKEDDRKAFIIMCKILHHQKIDDLGAQDLLKEVTKTANKYLCTREVLPAVLAPMKQLVLVVNGPTMIPGICSASDETVLVEILVAAYLAGDRSLFWQASRYRIHHYNRIRIRNRHDDALEENLPEDVISKSNRESIHITKEYTDLGEGAMHVLRRKSIQSLTEAVQTTLGNAIDGSLKAEKCAAYQVIDAEDCQRARALMGIFTLKIMDLKKEGPKKFPYDFMSIHQLCLALSEIGDQINAMAEEGSTLEECKSGHADGCRVSQIKIQPLIDWVLCRQLTLVPGLCLTYFEKYGDDGIKHELCTHVRYPERSW